MFFDNIIIFLNVLEQFAIRATIFDAWFEDLINNVSKLYFNHSDGFVNNILKNPDIENVNPRFIIKEAVRDVNKQIITDELFNKLEFKNSKTHINFIY
jgi:hypothetical protein